MECCNIISLIISLNIIRIVAMEGNSMKYDLTLIDKFPESAVFKEIVAPNRIHCASLCFNEGDCKGFGYKVNSTCFLMNQRIEEDFCSSDDCEEEIGIKLYMAPKEMTTEMPTTTSTTTKAPTTTTTTKEPTTTTTTKKPTTTTTKEPTTTTTTTKEPTTTTTTKEPSTTEKSTTTAPTTTTTTTQPATTPDIRERKAFEVKCGMESEFLRGFISKKQFFSDELVSPPTCYPLHPDPYVGGSAVSFQKEPDEEAFCPDNFAMTGIKFNTAADHLESMDFTCMKLKDDVMEKDETSISESADARSVDCGHLNVLAGVKCTKRDGEPPIYDLEIKCQKVTAPAGPGAGKFG